MRRSLLLAAALLPTLSGCLGHVLDDRRGDKAAPAPIDPPAASDDGADTGRACTPVTGDGVAVLAHREGLRPIGLVPNGARLWFVNDETVPASDDDPYPTLARGAWSVATAGGSLERAPIDDLEGWLTAFQGDLAYVRGERGASMRAIVLRDRATGAEKVVRSVENESVYAILSHPSGLFWTASSQVTGSKTFRFAEGNARELTDDGPSTHGMIADAAAVYYLRWRGIDDSRQELRLESIPLAGLAGEGPHVVHRLGDDGRFSWSLLGASADEIFVAVNATPPEPSSIRAIAKDGSGQRFVVRVASFASDPILEGDLLTWIDGDSGRSILQTTTAGAGVTKLATSSDGRRFGSVAVDRCNVYWTAVGEMRTGGATIYAKAREQAGR